MEEKLKEKYNALLERYKKGSQYLMEHPEEADKTNAELNKIEAELSKIIEALPDMTEEEKTEGFKLQDAKAEENAPKEKQDAPVQLTVKQDPTPTTNLSTFSDNWKIATQLAKSTLLPAEFQGKTENVIIALGMSQKMGIDFFTIAQNLHLVKGRLSWSGSFCKTLIEKTGQYKDLDLVYVGKENSDDYGCYLEATRIRDNKRIKGNTVTVKMAKTEGWWSRKDKYGNETSKWPTMTAQMLRL
jgi:hypothetical protein